MARQVEAERLRERIQALAVLLGHLQALCENLKVRFGPEDSPCKPLQRVLAGVTSFLKKRHPSWRRGISSSSPSHCLVSSCR